QVEHNTAKELIAKIETMTPDDEEFRATVKVLGEYVKHHVKEEENELFPAMRKAKVDLKELGAQLGERTSGLMEELGIAPTETPAQPRQRAAAGRAARRTT